MLIAGKLMHFQKFDTRCQQNEARGVATEGKNGRVDKRGTYGGAQQVATLFPQWVHNASAPYYPLIPLGALWSLPCAHQKTILVRGPCTSLQEAVRKVKPPTLTVSLEAQMLLESPNIYRHSKSHLGKHQRNGPQNATTSTSYVLHPRENPHTHSKAPVRDFSVKYFRLWKGREYI